MERKLNPRKLEIPKEVLLKRIQKQKTTLPKNRIIRFFYIFFGEGF